MKKARADETLKLWLLRSGIPFENDVAAILSSMSNLRIVRPYHFQMRNEDGNPQSRSLDFHAVKERTLKTIQSKDWHTTNKGFLHFLIDAKRLEDKRMVFVQHPNKRAIPSRSWALIPEFEHERSQGNFVTQSREDLAKFAANDFDLPLARLGVVVDPKSTTDRGIFESIQRQSIGGIVAETLNCAAQLEWNRDQVRKVADFHVFLPIVVTNSLPILINDGVRSEEVDQDQISAWSKEVGAVYVEQPNLIQIERTFAEVWSEIEGFGERRLRWQIPASSICPILVCTVEMLKPLLVQVMNSFGQLSESPQ